jgi:hypothetical protein
LTKSARRRMAKRRSETVAPVGTAAEAASAVKADAAQHAELQELRALVGKQDARLDLQDRVLGRLEQLVDQQATQVRVLQSLLQSAVALVGSEGDEDKEDKEDTLVARVVWIEEKIAELVAGKKLVLAVQVEDAGQSMRQSWAACQEALEEVEEAEWQEMAETRLGRLETVELGLQQRVSELEEWAREVEHK